MGIEEFLLDQAKREEIEEGMEKGMEEGMEKGMATGTKKTNTEIALKMKKNGIAHSLIANITGLSIEEIEQLS